jgi:hypothetical protein
MDSQESGVSISPTKDGVKCPSSDANTADHPHHDGSEKISPYSIREQASMVHEKKA